VVLKRRKFSVQRFSLAALRSCKAGWRDSLLKASAPQASQVKRAFEPLVRRASTWKTQPSNGELSSCCACSRMNSGLGSSQPNSMSFFLTAPTDEQAQQMKITNTSRIPLVYLVGAIESSGA